MYRVFDIGHPCFLSILYFSDTYVFGTDLVQIKMKLFLRQIL